MDKQKKQYVIVGVLIVVLVFVTLNSLKKKPVPVGKPEGGQIVPAAGIAPKLGTPAAEVVSLKPDEKKISSQLDRAKLAWGRDPFAAPSEREYQIGELRLKGISFDREKGGFAYINNDIVRKGDKIGNYEIIDIEKDRVFLKKGNQSFYLVFPGQEED